MADISLYIPCYNGMSTIARSIKSVLAVKDPPDDIIVIDDGSTDDTAAIIRSFPVRLIQHRRNLGLGAARNRGLKEAQHDWVASIDADVIMLPEWMDTILDLKEAFPNTAGFGGRLIETQRQGLANSWRCHHMRQEWGDVRIIKPPFLFGANTLMDRRKIFAAGGYDERMRTNGEDVNLAYKLYQMNESLVYDPQALCEHLRSDTFASVMKMRWAWYRSPYAILFPLRTTSELFKHIRKRSLKPLWKTISEDIKNGRLAHALLGVACAIDNIYREIRAYAKSRNV